MKLTLLRDQANQTATLGTLTYSNDNGDVVREWQTLELPWRNNETDESCIPAGKYGLTYKQYGRFFRKYCRKWEHKWVVKLDNVPERNEVLIHIGNYTDDTEGCILIGRRRNNNNTISASTIAYKEFYQMLEVGGKPEYIEIIDKPAEQKNG